MRILQRALHWLGHIHTLIWMWGWGIWGPGLSAVIAIAFGVWAQFAHVPGPIIGAVVLVTFTAIIWAYNGVVLALGSPPTTPNKSTQTPLPAAWLLTARDADRARLGELILITSRWADFSHLDAAEPYIDFMIHTFNGSVFTVLVTGVGGHISCVGEEFAREPELSSPRIGDQFPHGHWPLSIALRQRVSKETAEEIRDALSRADARGLEFDFGGVNVWFNAVEESLGERRHRLVLGNDPWPRR